MSGGRRQIDERLARGATARASFLSVVSAGRRVRRAYDEALEPFDLTLDRCRVLEALRHAGPDGLETEDFRAVLRGMGVEPAHAKRLEHEGWLHVDHDGTRRITEPGRLRLAELDPVLEEVDDRLAENLGVDEVRALRDILRRVAD